MQVPITLTRQWLTFYSSTNLCVRPIRLNVCAMLTSKHFLLNTALSGTPNCWFTEGVGWGGVGRGERELSSTFDQVTLFSPPLPLLIVSRLHACAYECIWITQDCLGSWMGKWSHLSSLFPPPFLLRCMSCLRACMHVCTNALNIGLGVGRENSR